MNIIITVLFIILDVTFMHTLSTEPNDAPTDKVILLFVEVLNYTCSRADNVSFHRSRSSVAYLTLLAIIIACCQHKQ